MLPHHHLSPRLKEKLAKHFDRVDRTSAELLIGWERAAALLLSSSSKLMRPSWSLNLAKLVCKKFFLTLQGRGTTSCPLVERAKRNALWHRSPPFYLSLSDFWSSLYDFTVFLLCKMHSDKNWRSCFSSSFFTVFWCALYGGDGGGLTVRWRFAIDLWLFSLSFLMMMIMMP